MLLSNFNCVFNKMIILHQIFYFNSKYDYFKCKKQLKFEVFSIKKLGLSRLKKMSKSKLFRNLMYFAILIVPSCIKLILVIFQIISAEQFKMKYIII